MMSHPAIPNYLTDTTVFEDRNMGTMLYAFWHGEPWLFKLHDDHWCSYRKCTAQDILVVHAYENSKIVATVQQTGIDDGPPNSILKFDKTYCSQCGREFGPGNHGYSHCKDHGGSVYPVEPAAQPTVAELADSICEELWGESKGGRHREAEDIEPIISEWLERYSQTGISQKP